jgi:ATPase subunit of ABC transporter with duplicated ATPase domains
LKIKRIDFFPLPLNKKKKQPEMRKGAEVIRQQIDERREAALLEQERRDQETRAILKHIEEIKQQEKEERQSRIQHQKQMMEEVRFPQETEKNPLSISLLFLHSQRIFHIL